MCLFIGKVVEDGMMEWMEYSLGEVLVCFVELEDLFFGQFVFGFEFFSFELGYFKCGIYLLEEQGIVEVCFNLFYNFDVKNMVVFIVLCDYNGLVIIFFEEENVLCFDCCCDGLFVGEFVKIIVIVEGEEGMYFLEEKIVIIMENLIISIMFEVVFLFDIMFVFEGL